MNLLCFCALSPPAIKKGVGRACNIFPVYLTWNPEPDVSCSSALSASPISQLYNRLLAIPHRLSLALDLGPQNGAAVCGSLESGARFGTSST